jgi:hypothetical protein
MITLLSPAKDLDMSLPAAPVKGSTQPRFLDEKGDERVFMRDKR